MKLYFPLADSVMNAIPVQVLPLAVLINFLVILILLSHFSATESYWDSSIASLWLNCRKASCRLYRPTFLLKSALFTITEGARLWTSLNNFTGWESQIQQVSQSAPSLHFSKCHHQFRLHKNVVIPRLSNVPVSMRISMGWHVANHKEGTILLTFTSL